MPALRRRISVTTPDPTSLGLGKAITNPANDPAADARGATHPSYGRSYTSHERRAVPGLTVGFSAQATQSTVVKLPFMELPLVGFTLAVITGLLNAFTLVYAGAFATVQAGNILLGGLAMVNGDWSAVLDYAIVMLSFGVGAFVGAVIISSSRTQKTMWMTWLLAALGVLIALLAVAVFAGFQDFMWITSGIALVAGITSNAYRKDSNMLFGALAVTFLIQMTASFLARAAFGRKGLHGVPNIKWAGVFFAVLLGFVLGALGGMGILVLAGANGVGGGAATAGAWVLLVVAVLYFVLAAYSKQTTHEGESVPEPPSEK